MFKHLAAALFERLALPTAVERGPDKIVGEAADPYLHRWWLLGSRPDPDRAGDHLPVGAWGLLFPYLHAFYRSDDDRALHDHPAWSLSLTLAGECIEHTIDAGGIHRRRRITAGSVRFRSARFAHRIEIPPGQVYWTLFIFGPKSRNWGFHCPNGWVPWERFTDPATGGSTVGRGCEP